MLTERKLTERELESREVVLRGLLDNKQNLVKKYGKDAEKVMYGIATKKAKSKVEGMNKEKIKELIHQALTVEDNDPSGAYLEGDPDEKVEETTVNEFVGGKLEKRSNVLFDKLVPGSGASDTVEGEMIRAINRLIYRFYNDGDFFYKGYGAETAGPAHSFLVNSNQIPFDLQSTLTSTFSKAIDAPEEGYERLIKFALEKILDHVEATPEDEYTKLDKEMFDFESEFEEDPYEDDDDYDYYDEDEYEDEEDYMQEVGGVNRKGEKIPDSEKDPLKKRPSIGIGNLMKEGHGLSQEDIDILKRGFNAFFVAAPKYGEMEDFRRVIKFILKSNILQDKTKDLSKEKANEIGTSGDQAAFDLANPTGGPTLDPIPRKVGKGTGKSYINRPSGPAKFPEGLSEKMLPVIRKKLGKAPKADKVASKQKMKLPSGMVSYMDFAEQVYEKLTKRNDVGDFVDDFKKSDAKQFKGKSAKKKKEMAVAAYLSKQNEK